MNTTKIAKSIKNTCKNVFTQNRCECFGCLNITSLQKCTQNYNRDVFSENYLPCRASPTISSHLHSLCAEYDPRRLCQISECQSKNTFSSEISNTVSWQCYTNLLMFTCVRTELIQYLIFVALCKR